MKILLIAAMMTAAYGQTGFPGPVQVLPDYGTSPLSIDLLDKDGANYIGLRAPTGGVYQIVITAATAANPMVLTLNHDAPVTLSVGGSVTISGAAGVGCASMNGSHVISAISGTSVTVSYNNAGCTYTASSATIATSIIFSVMDRDGAAGDCVVRSAAYVLGWAGCGGGVNQYLSNLLSPTAINQDLLPDTDDTYKIGDANRWYQVAANRFEGICSLCSWSDNYVTTRKLDLYEYSGLGTGFWSLATNVAATTSYMRFIDNLGADMLTLYRTFGGVTVNNVQLDGNLIPSADAAYDIGESSTPKRFRYLRLSSLAGGGTQCLQADNNGLVSVTGAGCGGAGSTLPVVDTTNIVKGSADATKQMRFEVDGFTTATTRTLTPQNASYTLAGIDLAQTFTATQTMQDILPTTDNTYKFGDDAVSKRWYQVASNRFEGICSLCSSSTNYVTTRKLDLYEASGLGSGFWTMTTNVGATTSYMRFTDNVGTDLLTLYRTFGGVTVNNAQFDGNLIPSADATYDIGSSTPRRFRNLRLSSLSGSGTRCVQTDTNGLVGLASGGCLSSPVTTTGDMIYSSSGTTLARLPIGAADGYCLIVSSGVPAWTNYGCNPITTRGDIPYGSGLGTPTRLAIGTSNQVMTVTCPLGNCVPQWSTFSGSGPIGYSAGTISCSTCVTSVSASSPIGVSGSTTAPTISCSTCVTTAGGQSISGTTTLSTASISSALTGTFSMSGTQTVSGSMTIKSTSTAGNFYNRVVSDPSVVLSCSGVTDGWTAIVHDGTGGAPYWVVCDNTGTRYKVALTAY